MENGLVLVIYNSLEYYLPSLPKSYTQLKNNIEKLLSLPCNYLVLIKNPAGSNTPVNSNKSYSRAIEINKKVSIEIVSVESSKESEPVISAPSKFSRKIPKNFPKNALEQIPESEMCVICYERLTDPMISKCKHVCCKICWEKALSNYLECPLCKSRVRLSQLRNFN